MNVNQLSVLVVGSGSIGRRHLRNLHGLGLTRLGVCDVDAERSAEAASGLEVERFAELDEGLGAMHPDAVFVCTPPALHVRQAVQAVRAGAHVFIEKPISNRLEEVDELIRESEATRKVAQVGYNLRFHPGLKRVKRLLEERVIGRVLWARAEFGQYLPDWRPCQDYRFSYTASREAGGGIILDDSHELDYMLWLLGKPVELVAMAGRVSDLAVNVEDCATLLVRFEDGSQADIHMDFVQQGYQRNCKLAGEHGTIEWDYTAKHVRLLRRGDTEWKVWRYEFEPNQMYVDEVEDFLACVMTGSLPAVDVRQAKVVLEWALAARRAMSDGVESVGD